MRSDAQKGNMLGIVFITVVRRNLFSFPWNETEDLIKEPDVQPGLVSSFLGRHRSSGMFVYDRCGWLVDELNTMFPKSPDDITHEWRVIRKAYNKACNCKPAPTTQPQPQAETTAVENNPN